MGFNTYCSVTRDLRASAMSYASAPVDQIFTQQREKRVHDSMKSQGVSLRECRDSELHKNTIPILLALDVTGSMGDIPKQLVASGLPTLMSTLIQRGVPDAALCFLAIGDHECDRFPVQVAQFESGDAELDMWLTRTYLESGGGGNGGESYPLAWEFAANRVQSDAWDKRKQKGFLFTIGDEPFLKSFPASAMREIYGSASTAEGTVSAEALYEAAAKKFHVIHISLDHAYRAPDARWSELLGANHIVTKDYREVPKIIANAVIERLLANGERPSTLAKETVYQDVPETTDATGTRPAHQML